MGTWSAGIFGNDLGSDLKSDYKDYLSKGLSNKEILDKLINDYNGDDPNDEDYPIFWISFAVIQWEMGRLSESIKTKAISIIDDTEYLKIWEDDAKLLEKRKKILKDTKEKLLSPQPPEKKVRKQPENICPYQINDIIFYKMDNGNYRIFHIEKYFEDKGGKYVICFVFDYNKNIIPDIKEIKDLKYVKNKMMLVSWHGNKYKKIVKEDRIGFIGNFKTKKFENGDCFISRWNDIDQSLDEYYAE